MGYPMKFIFASDSFKGSLTSEETIEMLTKSAKEIYGNVECIGIPIADGGEGTVDALLKTVNGDRIYVDAHGPLGDNISSYYGQLDNKRAIIEMAAASGLTLIPPGKRNPLLTSTFGTGELIKDALNKGFEELYIAIGGSATNDGGMGCARALGVRLLDKEGKELEGTGLDLERVENIDVSALDPRIFKTKITVLCDVNNPLCGQDGATYTYSAQKGADVEMQDRLEKGMRNYRDVIRKQFGIDPDDIKGGGAAGGLGMMLNIFLNGNMQSGIDTMLDIINFDQMISGADLIVTGEGCTDWQSCYGKVVSGIGKHAEKAGVPAVALSGSVGVGYENIFNHGISSIITTVNSPMSLDEAMRNAKELYYQAATDMFRLLKTGSTFKITKA